MYRGYQVVDADSHVMEPDELWDRYLDRRYRAFAPKTRRIATATPVWYSTEVMGHLWTASEKVTQTPYIADGAGGYLSYLTAYGDYVRSGFSAESYLRYLDRAGIDVAVLYPSLTLHST